MSASLYFGTGFVRAVHKGMIVVIAVAVQLKGPYDIILSVKHNL